MRSELPKPLPYKLERDSKTNLYTLARRHFESEKDVRASRAHFEQIAEGADLYPELKNPHRRYIALTEDGMADGRVSLYPTLTWQRYSNRFSIGSIASHAILKPNEFIFVPLEGDGVVNKTSEFRNIQLPVSATRVSARVESEISSDELVVCYYLPKDPKFSEVTVLREERLKIPKGLKSKAVRAVGLDPKNPHRRMYEILLSSRGRN